MKRKLLSLVLAFAMTAGLLTVGAGAAGPAYGDTAGHWAEGSIGRWSEHGIVQGSNGAFAPNAPWSYWDARWASSPSKIPI